MAFLRGLADRVDALNDRIGAAIHWLVLLMVLLAAGSALFRYASRQLGIALNLTPWMEAQWYMFSAVFLLGAAYALLHDLHVRVDVLFERLRPQARGWIDLIGTVLFLIPFCVLMLWVSFPAVRLSWRIRESSPDPGGLPRYPIKALLLVSFALLLLQAASQALRYVDRIRGREATGSAARAEPAGPEAPPTEPKPHV